MSYKKCPVCGGKDPECTTCAPDEYERLRQERQLADLAASGTVSEDPELKKVIEKITNTGK